VSLYLDTSCLWKLLVDEPESSQVRNLVGNEPEVIVSSYAGAGWTGSGRCTLRIAVAPNAGAQRGGQT
jgi:hypothetical protein